MTDSLEELTRLKDEDLPYEEELLRNPYSVKSWLRYLEFKLDAPPPVRNRIYERALKELPGSYKLWMKYLRERIIQTKGKPPHDPSIEMTINAFDRCVVFLGKMPKVWLEYAEFLISQRKITKTRRAFDQALRSVAITQHNRIWKLYTQFARSKWVPPKTGISIYKRFLKVEPEKLEEFVDYLVESEEWDEAAVQLVNLLNKDTPTAKSAKPKQELWLQLCKVIGNHSEDIKSIDFDTIIRGGLTKFSTDLGRLWTTLADAYIRLAQFDKARDIFEEGMNSVITVKDFAHVWDAYAKFEDELIASQMETMKDQTDEEEMLDFDLRMTRYEYLIERQPFLVNSVLLRQNPHNVIEWQKRVNLFLEKQDYKNVIEAYTQALKAIDPQKARGKPHTLWVNLAKFYADRDDFETACRVFDKATEANFKFTDDLASIWCEYAEMCLKHKKYAMAKEVLIRATTPLRTPRVRGEKDTVQRKVYKASRVWAMYADLEESFGTFETAKAAYEKMFELKAITPQIVINYALFLEENKYFEESFKAYEKGIALFKFPHVFDIWVTYLNKFVARYGNKKLERARELFEQVVASCPKADAKVFYLMYANLEEEYGLARHAMKVYEKATKNVAEQDRFATFCLYIARATELFGYTKTREIYEAAIEALPDEKASIVCLRYASLEKNLGEIDRARAIYVHGAQYSDPSSRKDYWQRWREFEVEHGNQDTFKEMLRIKRSIQTQFSSHTPFLSAEVIEATKKETSLPAGDNAMEILERQAAIHQAEKAKEQGLVQFTSEKPTEEELEELVDRNANPEEIVLEEGEEEPGAEEVEIEQMAVPEAVIARNLKRGTEGGPDESKLSTLAKLKRRKKE